MVTSKDGTTLPNASIIVVGQKIGETAASNGTFSIKVPANAKQLSISYLGYETREVSINGQTNVSVTLQPSMNNLNEVIITGYTSQRKKDITGSVAVVNVSDLESVPANSVENQLQGRAARVTVVEDNEPGSVAKVRIRGFASFNGNDPLYIVEGVPTGSLLGINPEDVESMQILKDAALASIYGSRASILCKRI